MKIFEINKSFPPEEKFALTGQSRHSSRSVCMNLLEAWAKRRYPNHFISKLIDCDGENSETDTCIEFARDCGYITKQQYFECVGLCNEVGKMLGSMIYNPEKSFLQNQKP